MKTIPQLNAFTYLALSTKIDTLKPKALQQLASKLVSYGNISSYDNNHAVYSILCYNKALERLHSISKLTLLKGREFELKYRLGNIEKFIDPTNDITDLTELFKTCSQTVYWYIKTIDQLILTNNLLKQQTKHVTQLDIKIELPAIKELTSSNIELINKQIILNILGTDAAILEYLPTSSFYNKTSMDKFNLNDLTEIAKAVTQVRQEHDNEYKKQTID